MWVKKEEEIKSFYDLKANSWSGALDTLEDIENADLEEELMEHLEEIFRDSTPTETEVNDYLWHDRESVYYALGLNENGELEEEENEEEEEKEILSFEKALDFVGTLKGSQGFYGRLYEQMKDFSEEEKAEFKKAMEENSVCDTMDLILFLES